MRRHLSVRKPGAQPRRFRMTYTRRDQRNARRDYYLFGRSQGSCRRPYNRVCFACRRTFPGNEPHSTARTGFRPQPGQGRRTELCACGRTPVTVTSTLRMPRRHQIERWAKLEAQHT